MYLDTDATRKVSKIHVHVLDIFFAVYV